jgi:hypothetical protein
MLKSRDERAVTSGSSRPMGDTPKIRILAVANGMPLSLNLNF